MSVQSAGTGVGVDVGVAVAVGVDVGVGAARLTVFVIGGQVRPYAGYSKVRVTVVVPAMYAPPGMPSHRTVSMVPTPGSKGTSTTARVSGS